MAIAPSQLGRFVGDYWNSPETLVAALRKAELVNASAADEDVKRTLQRAKDEHALIAEPMRMFNTPSERVRVFLEPYLTQKGKLWAEPLVSLDLPDDSAVR